MLTAGGSDTAVFTVTDNSVNSNKLDFPVIVRHNRPVTQIVAGLPVATATGVSRTPTFTWTGGTDPDGDPVSYRVFYGASETALTSQTGIVISTSVTLTTTLPAISVYYWQVIAYTANYTDTTRSDIRSFTTTDIGSSISSHLANQQVMVGQTATFIVEADGTSLRFQWQEGVGGVYTDISSGANATSYTTPITTAAYNGRTYRCVVTNSVGPATSNPATLSVLHTVTYNANGATNVTAPIDPTGYALGSSVNVSGSSGLAMPGRSFKGWTLVAGSSGKAYNSANTTDTLIMPLRPVTFYAKWVIDTFTVTFNGNGGTPAVSTQRVAHNGQALLPNPQPNRSGYGFNGWYTTNPPSGAAYDFVTLITANRHLYAGWNTISYSIGYETYGASANPNSVNFYNVESSPITFQEPRKTGYTFGGWFFEPALSTSANVLPTGSTGNRYLYAKWSPTVYSISYHTDGTMTNPNSNIYTSYNIESTLITLHSPSRDGYDFRGWYLDPGFSTYANSIPASSTGIRNFYARWDIKTYYIHYNNLDGGATNNPSNPSTFTVTSNPINLQSPSRNDYDFQGWFLDEALTDPAPTLLPTGSINDRFLFAKWSWRGTLTDADNNVYNTVTIGNQVWINANFRSTKYTDGSPITHITTDSIAWSTTNSGAYCYLRNTTDLTEQRKFGALYNYYAIESGKLVPEGWLVSTTADWTTLINYLRDNGYAWNHTIGSTLLAFSIATATTDWGAGRGAGNPGYLGGSYNNQSGFTGAPAGCRYSTGGNYQWVASYSTYWWASYPNGYNIWRESSYIEQMLVTSKNVGYSIRFVKDQ